MFCALYLSGCGYSIHGKAALPFDSIQIERIENKTFEPKLQDMLYRALAEEFRKQGISVSPGAGHKLSGTIHKFDLQLLTSKGDVAAEYQVIIKGDFKLTDPSGKSKVFKNIGSPFFVTFSGPGALNELIASKELASEKALKDMAMEIVAALLYR